MKARISSDNRKGARTSTEKVPILRPQEIEKLDTLKRMSIKPDQNQKRVSIRHSIRPSNKEGQDPNHHKKYHSKKQTDKKEEDSGFTKNSTQRSFDGPGSLQKKRKNRAIQQGQEKGFLCCKPKVEENEQENPFKVARDTKRKK